MRTLLIGVLLLCSCALGASSALAQSRGQQLHEELVKEEAGFRSLQSLVDTFNGIGTPTGTMGNPKDCEAGGGDVLSKLATPVCPPGGRSRSSAPQFAFDRTVDGMLFERSYNSTYYGEFQGISDLILGRDYSSAQKALADVESRLNAMRIMLKESVDVPLRVVLSESRVDEYMDAVSAQIPPGLSGRQVRALLYSEILLDSALSDKAHAYHCPGIGSADARLGLYGFKYNESMQKLLMLDYRGSHAVNFESDRYLSGVLSACGHAG